jgi:hypothetical protein
MDSLQDDFMGPVSYHPGVMQLLVSDNPIVVGEGIGVVEKTFIPEIPLVDPPPPKGGARPDCFKIGSDYTLEKSFQICFAHLILKIGPFQFCPGKEG